MTFSLITCTYNPSPITFDRLVNAIKKMGAKSNNTFEWIIIDNNSSPAIENQFHALNNLPCARVVKEPKPGLTYARMTGVCEATNDWIVFFDDDNEPKPDYLDGLKKLIEKYPDVICWGAGNISVEFLDPKTKKTVKKHRRLYQERHLEEELIIGSFGWGKQYPVGTGMCVKRDGALSYIELVRTGTYTATDRTGRSLISGGDTQQCLHLLKLGSKIGISPLLKLHHLIEKRKANLNYLMRQQYWTASSFVMVYNQVAEEKLPIELLGQTQILRKSIKQFYYFIKVKKMDLLGSLVAISTFMGNINARYIASNKPSPKILSIFEKIIR